MNYVTYDPKFIFDMYDAHVSQLNDSQKIYLKSFKTQINNTLPVTKDPITNKVGLKWRTEPDTNIKIKTTLDYSKDIYLYLNKLSDTNLDVVAFEINTIIAGIQKTEDKTIVVENCINRLFESAKIQINFCHLYAHLFYKLASFDENQYTKTLEKKIKEEFTKIDNMKNVNVQENYDEYCLSVNLKDNYLGCYQFCVELYNYKVLTSDNLNQIIGKIMEDLKIQTEKYQLEIIIECLCRVIKTAYKSQRMTSSEKKQLIDKILKCYNYSKNKLKARSRFIFEDIIQQHSIKC